MQSSLHHLLSRSITTLPTIINTARPPASRICRIFRPSKTCTQSAPQGSQWKIDFDAEQKWENRATGWASTADPMHSLATLNSFESKEAAIRFAEKQGWTYLVHEPKEESVRINSYSDNYKHIPGKIKLIKTK